MGAPIVVLTSLAALALAVVPAAHGQTLKKVADADRIVAAYREAAVPFSYLISPTKAVGFSVDLTEAIVDEVRRQVKRPQLALAWVPVTGQNRIPLLVEGKVDLECGSTTNTAARGKDVAFSISFFYAGTRMLARKDSGVGAYADLAGKKVATVAGSTNEKVMQAYATQHQIAAQWQPAKDYRDAFESMQSGRAAAMVLDDVLLYGLRANAEDPASMQVLGEPLQVEPYGCMVRKDDPEFKKLVDRVITKLMTTGEFTRLYKRWFQSPIPPRGAVIDMPMSAALVQNIQQRSDKPAN
ncbi:MAG: amino acid ABC transporter substrate-binding protein [Rubrivivax sp.]|nr:amino acid ABC transporter substrate-binding protein [Rubrivivax sp.]